MTELVDKLSVFLIRRSNFVTFINLKSQHEFKVMKKLLGVYSVRAFLCLQVLSKLATSITLRGPHNIM